MNREQVFNQDAHLRPANDEQQQPRAVVVELSGDGSARIREAPPDVLVMIVESKEIAADGSSRSVAAGGRGEFLASEIGTADNRPIPQQIPVSFPG